MKKSNYDKFPFVAVQDAAHEILIGWDKIAQELQRAIGRNRTEKPILVVECYAGVDEFTVLNELQTRLAPRLTIHAADAYHSSEKIDTLVAPFLDAEESAICHVDRLSLVNFFNAEPLWRLRRTIDELKDGLVLVVGCGASLIAWGHTLVYANLARQEALQRLQRNEAGNLGADNKSAPANLKHRRAFFVDWPVIDRWKRPLIKRWDYVLETNISSDQKLADAKDVRRGLRTAAKRPFRMVPFFDAAPWCGREVKEALDSNRETKKFAPCFDCKLEEMSLLLGFGDIRFEVPAIDLIFNQPHALLGEAVYARFRDRFPIHFDSLDTMSRFEPLCNGDGWREERAELNERAFIELRRHWFSKIVTHDTRGGVNVLNLVEGEEAMVENPVAAFEPFVVHHAETFIVPAAVGRYDIRPHGQSIGKEIAIIKAFVRT